VQLKYRRRNPDIFYKGEEIAVGVEQLESRERDQFQMCVLVFSMTFLFLSIANIKFLFSSHLSLFLLFWTLNPEPQAR
jgi:hypothetical protein